MRVTVQLIRELRTIAICYRESYERELTDVPC